MRQSFGWRLLAAILNSGLVQRSLVQQMPSHTAPLTRDAVEWTNERTSDARLIKFMGANSALLGRGFAQSSSQSSSMLSVHHVFEGSCRVHMINAASSIGIRQRRGDSDASLYERESSACLVLQHHDAQLLAKVSAERCQLCHSTK